jgi:hypothetical protein
VAPVLGSNGTGEGRGAGEQLHRVLILLSLGESAPSGRGRCSAVWRREEGWDQVRDAGGKGQAVWLVPAPCILAVLSVSRLQHRSLNGPGSEQGVRQC